MCLVSEWEPPSFCNDAVTLVEIVELPRTFDVALHATRPRVPEPGYEC
jgi:hypothetical protein